MEVWTVKALGSVTVSVLAVAGCTVLLLKAAGQAGRRPAIRPSATSQPAAGARQNMVSRSGYDLKPLTRDRVAELAKGLDPKERDVLLGKGTEPAFCGLLLNNKEKG